MIFKNKNTQNNIKPKEEPKKDIEQPVEQVAAKPIRKIINGKLYDTSKAKYICKCSVDTDTIPMIDIYPRCYTVVLIYKGNTEWFIVIYRDIVVVDEFYIKAILGKSNVEKYIELFGEPELA